MRADTNYEPTALSMLGHRRPRTRRNKLIPLKQIARINLTSHVGQLVAPAVCHYHVALGLEGRQVVRHLGTEELGCVERGLVHHHGHALGLDALHDALHARRTEVIGAGLHGEAVHAHDQRRSSGLHELGDLGKRLAGDVVLSGAVGVDDGLDQVLRHVLVVGQQLLGVLGQAVAAVAEAGVVVMAADARLQAHALDDLRGIQGARAKANAKHAEKRTANENRSIFRTTKHA